MYSNPGKQKNIISLFNNSLPDFSNLITFTSFKSHSALQGKNMKTYML